MKRIPLAVATSAGAAVLLTAALAAPQIPRTAGAGPSLPQPESPAAVPLSPAALRELMSRISVKTQDIPSPPPGSWGIVSSGSGGGGIFRDANGGAEAWLGTDGYGIEAFGITAGGWFQDADDAGQAYLAVGEYGVQGFGYAAGGLFSDPGASGAAFVGYGDTGIEAYGNAGGGHFWDTDSTGEAYVGWGYQGISASGSYAGGYLSDSNASGYAYIGFGDYGIQAYGNNMGGSFHDIDASTYSYVGFSTYKIIGSGSVSFVQNHPADPGAVIVYAAPEGDEVATYTRGTARLESGEARVALGETFKWVTNPDLGLTAYVTPRGEAVPLAVASLSPEELVVRGPADAPEGLVFDYIVYGLRIGFEATTVVQEKQEEAFIPSMRDHRERIARHPELARYTAQARLTAQREALGGTEKLDTSRAAVLVAAVHEFDPAVDRIRQPRPEQPLPETASAPARATAAPRLPPGAETPAGTAPAAGGAPRRPIPALAREDDVYARSFRPAAGDLASLVEVSDQVETGDVLVIDRTRPGALARSRAAEDRAVAGVVAGDAGVLLAADAGGAEGRAAVAFSGVALCKVDATYGAVEPGDLLVTSPTAGHAMRSDNPLPGTVVGKALQPLGSGKGLIRILVTLR